LSFILEKYLHTLRHYHPQKTEIKSFGPLNLLADGMHNFLDGILIAVAYKIDVHTGVIATAVVPAHQLPKGIGDFAVLTQAGFSKRKALVFNFISALSAFGGGLLILLFPSSGEEFSHFVLPLAAGGFIYIALADLIPEIIIKQSASKSILQVIFLLFGNMYLLLDIHFLHH
jgi:zinc and cadmium transporter